VNLANSGCLGNPRAVIPGVQYFPISSAGQFQISPSTFAAHSLAYSRFNNSYLNVNPPKSPKNVSAYVQSVVPSYDGVLVKWNSSSCAVGSLYSVSVLADIVGVPNCHAVWDFTLQLEQIRIPSYASGAGSETIFTTQGYNYVHRIWDLRFVDCGDWCAAERAVLSYPAPGQVQVVWARPVAGSYSFSVQFCNAAAMCGACSATINVNDALPQIEVTTASPPTSVNATGVGANYTYMIVVENSSIGVTNVILSTVQSSVDGTISQCRSGTLINATNPYICT
jgi:hypothetical protein